MSFEVVIPSLAFRSAGNELDLGLTKAYAERAAGTWADRFILSGSTVLGDLLAPTERALILDVWSELLEHSRLVACCWCREDVEQAGQRKILPLVVMRDLRDQAQACSFFAGLPGRGLRLQQPQIHAHRLGSSPCCRRRVAQVTAGGCEDLEASGRRHRADPLQHRGRVYALGRLLPSH